MTNEPESQGFTVTANGRLLDPDANSYGDAVSTARAHAPRTSERTQVDQHQRLPSGRIVNHRARWRSDHEGS